ncbi:unnamed protein product [Lactuca saligna]|uniref:Uncharacterized protein n=1 Tax=Lactuca saligna TaxID=75948 RepID=A0AA35YP23_LACSI|nr:unnamed protein product [Lactuca saligna]
MASESSIWEVRNSSAYLDLYNLYGWENKKYFSIMLNHGGSFLYYPNRDYIGGIIDYIDFIDVETFSTEKAFDNQQKVAQLHVSLDSLHSIEFSWNIFFEDFSVA